MLGYSRDEALSMALHELVAPHLVDRHRAGIARYAGSGTGSLVDSGTAVQVEAIRKDGSLLPVDLTLSSVPEAQMGGDRIVMALIRDATEAVAATKLKEALARQRAALEIHDSIVQGMAVSKAWFEMGDHDRGMEYLSRTLTKAQSMVTDVMRELEEHYGVRPGDFVRSAPATLEVNEEP
jgi:PAS domain S-box-containing protein